MKRSYELLIADHMTKNGQYTYIQDAVKIMNNPKNYSYIHDVDTLIVTVLQSQGMVSVYVLDSITEEITDIVINL